MGRVYLGRTGGGRTVAVKMVHANLADDTEFRTRFRREVAAARRVAGPYTVPVLDADLDARRPWLATGFVSGMSLTDAVEAHGPLPEQSLYRLAAGLSRALADVHTAGMVHRDLKPSNVLLSANGPRVIDFGIARAADDTVLTTTGKIIGSPGYMCPEQITGEVAVGPPGDVFSLGGVLVYAATGAGPFGSGHSASMLWLVVEGEPRLDGVPGGLRDLAAACLAKQPESRPTPTELAERLAGFDPAGPGGWLPGPLLQDIINRTEELLHLDAPSSPAPPAPPPTSTTLASQGSWPAPGQTPPAGQSWPQHPAATAGPAHPPPGSAMAAPYQGAPHQHQPNDPPARRGRRGIVLGAVAAALVVVGVVSGILAYNSASGNKGGGSSTVAADTPTGEPATDGNAATTETGSVTPSSDAAGSSATLPADYVGTWKGTAEDIAATYDIVVNLHDGKVGDELGSSSNTGQRSNQTCARAETLTAADTTSITLRARLTGGAQCLDDGQSSTLTLHQDGTATYTMEGPIGDISGTLRHR